jgi:hypothetical protein
MTNMKYDNGRLETRRKDMKEAPSNNHRKSPALMGSSGILKLVGWDDARCRPIYRRADSDSSTIASVASASAVALASEEDANGKTKKSKVRVKMNDEARVSSMVRDAALEIASITTSSLEDVLGNGTAMAMTQAKQTTVETKKKRDCRTKTKRSKKARALSLSPPKTVISRNANEFQVSDGKQRKRSYGTSAKPVESSIRVASGGACSSTRLRLGWDEVKCRPIYYEHCVHNAAHAAQDANNPSKLPKNTKLLSSVNKEHEADDIVHSDSLHNKRTTTTQKKRVYATHFRRNAGLSRAVLEEMEIHSPTSIQ